MSIAWPDRLPVATSDADCLLDGTDAILLRRYRLRLRRDGYVVIQIKHAGEVHQLAVHRLLMGAAVGATIDHINGNKLDNRRSNLRIATNQQNQINRTRPSRANKSGSTGVMKTGNRWLAYYHKGGKQIRVGIFDTIDEANAARYAAVVEAFGDFAPRMNHAHHAV